jgi:2-polyprenyl-3-methyl-5-hydroxy-6-metoxy-1,4-benzoquinol methylase
MSSALPIQGFTMANTKDLSFPKESFSDLASAESQHWWFRARNRFIIWVLETKAPSFLQFLEIGCGTGFVLEGIHKAFPMAKLLGAELYEEGLVHAKKRLPDVEFKQLDATKLKEIESYEAIGAFDVIEHIVEDVVVLKNLSNSLCPGGFLLISVPQHMCLWSIVDDISCHKRRYSRKELFQKVDEVGLKITYATSFVSLLFPVMFFSRLWQKDRDYDRNIEFKISKSLQWVLEKIMKFEHALIKTGITMPFGGSLLVLARKP